MMDEDTTILGLRRGSLVLERYEIRDLLGRGGFAAVFLAHDTEIERDVALKVLDIASLTRQGGDAEILLTRFKREAKLAARINHPSVVQVFDYGVLEKTDAPFIIMEKLEGHDLDEELQQHGPMAPDRALPLFTDCLEALGDAHQLGIVHKDLKPSNLFLTSPRNRRETLKIVDFGIAHPGDAAGERLTKTGFMLGTIEYMPPEYIQDQIISPALDVYQMGLILVELLSGQPVVVGDTPWQIAMAHIRRDFEIPALLWDSPVGPVIDRSLAVEPQDRFEGAGEFADALAAIDPDELSHVDADDTLQHVSIDTPDVQVPDDETRSLIEEASRERQLARQQSDRRSTPSPFADTAFSESPADPVDDTPTDPADVDTAPSELLYDPSRTRRSRLIIAALAAVALITLVGIGFVASALLSGEPDDQAQQHRAEADETSPIEPEQPAELPQPSAAEESQPDDEQHEPIEVAIAADPTDALITSGDDTYDDDNPVVFASDDDDPVNLEVTADGHEARTVTVAPGDTPTFDVALDPEDDPGDETPDDAEPSAQPPPAPQPASDPDEPVEQQQQDEPAEQTEQTDQEDEPAATDDDDDDDDGTDMIMAP